MEGPLFEIRSTKEAALAQRDIVLMRTTMETIRALANTIGVAGSLHLNFAGLDEGLAIAVSDMEDRISELDEALVDWAAAHRLEPVQ